MGFLSSRSHPLQYSTMIFTINILSLTHIFTFTQFLRKKNHACLKFRSKSVGCRWRTPPRTLPQSLEYQAVSFIYFRGMLFMHILEKQLGKCKEHKTSSGGSICIVDKTVQLPASNFSVSNRIKWTQWEIQDIQTFLSTARCCLNWST